MKIKIRHLITIPTSILVTLFWIALCISIYFYTKSLITESFEKYNFEQTRGLQALVKNELTTGNYLRVRAQLEQFVTRSEVNSVLIVDKNNNRIEQSNILDQHDSLYKEVLKRDSPFRGYLNFDKISRFVVMVPIKFEGFNENIIAKMIISYDLLGLNSQLKHLQIFLGLVVCIAILSQTLTLLYIERYISRPLFNLINLLKNTAKTGWLDNIQTNAYIFEIEQLGDEYNKMVSCVKEYQNNMQRVSTLAAVGKTASQVAHDIRSPLSSMQTAIEYLGHLRIDDPKGIDVLNLLELSAKRLTGIADDLLNKHQGGGNLPKSNIFSIHQVLDELVGEFQGQEKYHKVQFVKEYSSQAIHLRGDAAKIQRAFGNIIKNGAEAMEFDGFVTLQTSCDQERATISITDTGPGISSDTLKKVLQGGFTEGKEDGHGIGTKVVRETVEEHQGQLRATSIIGQGTTFFIDLPLSVHSDKTTTFTLTLNPKETVLIVDDDAGLREQWRLILSEHGITTLLCESYEDAVRQGVSPELTPAAIVDYHFENSEKNGVDIVKYLQSIGFQNLYLCTAEYWKPLLQRESDALGVSVCPKPIPKIVIKSPVIASEPAVIASEAKQSSHNKRWIASSPSVPRHDKGYNVLVIDDDTSIRMSWDLLQQKLKIENLHCYENLETLQTNGCDLTTIDIAFVDKNIENSQFTGADVLQYLRNKGIPKIIIASGETQTDLTDDPLFQTADQILSEKIPTTLRPFFPENG